MRSPKDIGFFYVGRLKARPAPTAAQWALVERRVGAPLPDDYKGFLALQNGGAPEVAYVPVTDHEGFLIECLNYVDGRREDGYDVEEASRWPSEDLGEQVVAIAPDGSGDQLILRRAGDTWCVQWWRHDEPTTVDVAQSFAELLDRLTVVED